MWREINISKCRFHLTQAWYHKIVNRLSSIYKNKSSEILFLNSEDLSDCFIEDFMSDCSIDEQLYKFTDYLVETYISENCIYPPQLWAFASSKLTRTTNAYESFHALFKNSFYRH